MHLGSDPPENEDEASQQNPETEARSQELLRIADESRTACDFSNDSKWRGWDARLVLPYQSSSARSSSFSRASLNPPPGLVPPPGDQVWCGASFKASAWFTRQTRCGGEQGGEERSVIVKASGGKETYFDSELHVREAMTSCLDQALGTHIVPPTSITLIQDEEAKVLLGETDGGEWVAHTQCGGVRVNATHASISASMLWGGVNVVKPENWEQIVRSHIDIATARDLHEGAPQGIVPYAVINYVGGCMRSSHNHHYREVSGRMEWVVIDNDRCFVRSTVGLDDNVPGTHRWRLEQWEELVTMLECELWPADLKERVLSAASSTAETGIPFVRRALSDCLPIPLETTQTSDRPDDDLEAFWSRLFPVEEVIAEADERLQMLARHLEMFCQ